MGSLAQLPTMPESTALVPAPAGVQLGTLSATTGAGLLEAAASLATPLKALIDSRHLSNVISGRPYVKCEGWTAMAAMLGITPHEVSVTEQDGIYVATVELRRIVDGGAIARASAECGAPDELDRQGKPLWASRPRYARRSMALTRATAKACRLAFSWVIVLAGYEATPAEEMPDHGTTEAPAHTAAKGAAPTPPATPRAPTPGATRVGPDYFRVTDVQKKDGSKDNRPWTKYTVTFDDGRAASTFDTKVGALAARAYESGEQVARLLTENSNPKFLPDLTELVLKAGNGETVAPPASEPDDPFGRFEDAHA